MVCFGVCIVVYVFWCMRCGEGVVCVCVVVWCVLVCGCCVVLCLSEYLTCHVHVHEYSDTQ